MDSILKMVAVAGLGAFGYHLYLKDQAEKSEKNPDEDIERELENRLRELNYRESVIARM